MTRSVWRKRVKVIGLLLTIMMLGFWVFSVMFVSYCSNWVSRYVSVRSLSVRTHRRVIRAGRVSRIIHVTIPKREHECGGLLASAFACLG